jgi:pimeloyl-ACP methyl ester carboxylesterase
MIEPTRQPLSGYDAGQSHATTVVLLHGGFLLHNMWHPQLQPLSQRYHVLAPDMIYNDLRQLTLPNLARDVAALIQSKAKTPVYLVGLSLGAAVATQIAIDQPQLVKGLILSGGRAKTGMVDKLTTNLTRLMPENSLLNSFLSPTLDIYPLLDGIAQKDVERVRKAGFVQSLRALEGIDFTKSLSSIHVPTLVLVGSDDRPHFLREAEKLKDLIPGAELRVIADVGHGWNLEAPELFTETVIEFVEGVEGNAG